MMSDPIYEAFLARQYEKGMALAESSDILTLRAYSATPVWRYLATFRCRGLVSDGRGGVTDCERFDVGIAFPPDYLRCVREAEVTTLLSPRGVWHPNISAVLPWICAGRITPGTELVDLLYRLWEILTYRKVTMREDDALNAAACVWARANQDRFPTDTRPLKRRLRALRIEIQNPDLQGDDA